MNAAAKDTGFFNESLASRDPEIAKAMEQELGRQRDEIELIASENIVSAAVMEAQGGVMTNKYAEGYPGRRYYGGCQYVDVAENLAIERAKEMFGVQFANVQPNSGSQANQGVFQALIKPGDTILGMSLDAGGHLTHGAKPNQSGKIYNAIQYGVRQQDSLLDYDQVQELATEHQPKMIIAGGSAIPRIIDFARMREIADSVGAYLFVDMAHFAGLVAAGLYPSPFPHAHVATSTTHKTLRGPRGGIIVTNDEDLAKKFNSAIFPGIQGGPLMHVIAGKAVAFDIFGATRPSVPWAVHISPVTKTVFRLTQKNRWSRPAFVWAALRAQRAALPKPSSARSPIGLSKLSTVWPPMAKTATTPSKPRSAPKLQPCARTSRCIQTYKNLASAPLRFQRPVSSNWRGVFR